MNWQGEDIIDAFEEHVRGKAPNADGEVTASWDWISTCARWIVCIDITHGIIGVVARTMDYVRSEPANYMHVRRMLHADLEAKKAEQEARRSMNEPARCAIVSGCDEGRGNSTGCETLSGIPEEEDFGCGDEHMCSMDVGQGR